MQAQVSLRIHPPFHTARLKYTNPSPDMPILGSSNSAANKYMDVKNMGQNWTQLSGWVENIVEKGEIA